MNSGSNQSEKNRARATAGNGAATSRQVAALTAAARRHRYQRRLTPDCRKQPEVTAAFAVTQRGKAPWEVARRCAEAGVRCVVFGGRVDEPLPGVETVALSGDPSRAAADLVELGRRLGSGLDRV